MGIEGLWPIARASGIVTHLPVSALNGKLLLIDGSMLIHAYASAYYVGTGDASEILYRIYEFVDELRNICSRARVHVVLDGWQQAEVSLKAGESARRQAAAERARNSTISLLAEAKKQDSNNNIQRLTAGLKRAMLKKKPWFGPEEDKSTELIDLCSNEDLDFFSIPPAMERDLTVKLEQPAAASASPATAPAASASPAKAPADDPAPATTAAKERKEILAMARRAFRMSPELTVDSEIRDAIRDHYHSSDPSVSCDIAVGEADVLMHALYKRNQQEGVFVLTGDCDLWVRGCSVVNIMRPSWRRYHLSPNVVEASARSCCL